MAWRWWHEGQDPLTLLREWVQSNSRCHHSDQQSSSHKNGLIRKYPIRPSAASLSFEEQIRVLDTGERAGTGKVSVNQAGAAKAQKVVGMGEVSAESLRGKG